MTRDDARPRLWECWRGISLTIAWLLVPALASAADDDVRADLVLYGGKVVTLDEENSQAEAVAVLGGRIVFVGDNETIKRWIDDDTRVIDLRGRVAFPGFIEGHGHYVALGRSKMVLDLTRATSWDEIVELVRRQTAQVPKGQWILGRGWHQTKWKQAPQPNVTGYPIHTRLSAISPDHPVWLTHASGHAGFANARAMQLAGVDDKTANPPGGEILHDAQGRPTGVFRETAQSIVARRVKNASAQDMRRAAELAEAECLANGITSFQDAGSSFAIVDMLRELARRGELKVRLWVMLREENATLARLLPKYRIIGGDNHYLTVRAIKRSIDGALGSHGAWLLQPYDDLTSSIGLNTATVSSVRETARLAMQHDFQLCVHAIGDRANRETLDLFEAALQSDTSRRWRIEHAQHLHPRDIPRFAKLGVIASMQGIHCTSDAVFVFRRLGQRRAASGAYMWQDLLRSGAVIVNGTDAPVEDVNPIASFYASVTRKLPSGEAFFADQRMTREQALRSYTTAAAYAAFEEDLKGSLEVGKLADIVVLSNDVLTCPESEILKTKVVYTIVGGDVRYELSD